VLAGKSLRVRRPWRPSAFCELAWFFRADILVVSIFGRSFVGAEGVMARSCEVCGKGPVIGNSVTTRGKAKYLGGVGTKITGITKRQFKPNLQRVRVTVRGTNKSMRVCTQCIRSGAITKLVKAAPFKLPPVEGAAAKAAPKKK
jgi:large subunit ribosomal protein L28